MQRYGNIDYIMKLDLAFGLEILNKIYEEKLKEVEEKRDNMIWDMWLAKYPWMDKDSFISFEDFRSEILISNETKEIKTKEEIVTQAEDIIKAWKGGKN